MARTEAGTSTERLPWVDVAKALAIALVVVYHVALTGTARLIPGSEDLWSEAWRDLSRMLLPVRMPLFFLVSGLLAQSAIRRPWSSLWQRRVADLLWPFALWSLVYGLAVAQGYSYAPGGRREVALDSWAAIPYGGTAYWYLSVLVVLFLIARLLRRYAASLLLIAFAAWIGTGVITQQLGDLVAPELLTNVGRVATFGIWFFLGAFGRPVISRLAGASPWPTLLVGVGLYAALAHVVYGVGGAGKHWGYALSVLGVFSALLLSVQLARSERVVRVSQQVAPRTLAIYVVHPVVLNVVVWVTRTDDGPLLARVSDSPVTGLVFVPVMTVALVAFSIALARAAERWGAPWLFRAPRRTDFQRRH